VRDYAVVAPMLCLTTMFGFSAEAGRQLGQLVIDTLSMGPAAATAQQKMAEVLLDHVRSRREAPAGDMASLIARHPNLRSDDEVVQELVITCIAAFDSCKSWTAQTLQLMLTNPRFAGRLRGGRLTVDDAMDEVLWRDPPVANMPARYALRDTELGGQQIEAGDPLILGLAPAGTDTAMHTLNMWEEVGNRSHLAWSAGPHTCPAQGPARAVCRTTVETVLNALPGVRLAVPDDEVSIYPSPWARCPSSLPVVFTPVK
jgi:cytochrome P450